MLFVLGAVGVVCLYWVLFVLGVVCLYWVLFVCAGCCVCCLFALGVAWAAGSQCHGSGHWAQDGGQADAASPGLQSVSVSSVLLCNFCRSYPVVSGMQSRGFSFKGRSSEFDRCASDPQGEKKNALIVEVKHPVSHEDYALVKHDESDYKSESYLQLMLHITCVGRG